MKILISFCNSQDNCHLQKKNISHLGLLSTTTQSFSFLKLPNSISFNSIAGLTQNEGYIYATFTGQKTGVFTINKKEPKKIKITILPNLIDPHSMLADQKHLYIVSTGQDTVYKHCINKSGTPSPTKYVTFWKPTNSKGYTDTHHINSLTRFNNQILVSAFGPRIEDKWSSAKDGYIYNISQKKYISKNIYHPHTLAINKSNYYICESGTGSVQKNNQTIITTDTGYVRGLVVDTKNIYFGISSGRKISKSTGITHNPADTGEREINCKLVFGTQDKYHFYDFSAFHLEIYDLLKTNITVKEPLKTHKLNKFETPYSKKGNKIYTLYPKSTKYRTHTSSFAFEKTHPQIKNNSAWNGHQFFIYDLICATKPKTVVELGTYQGFSFFSMCQAVKDKNINSHLYAIDTWKGDKHAGKLPQKTYQTVNNIIKTHYSNTPITLIKSTFDKALDKFKNKSIDLLHIDGLHTYSAIKNDFLNWLPKMTQNGIIIFHDTQETQHDFGVKLLWQELQKKYETLEFFHSHGLGVLFLDKPTDLNTNHLISAYYSQKHEQTKIVNSLQNNHNLQISELITQNANFNTKINKQRKIIKKYKQKDAQEKELIQAQKKELIKRISETQTDIINLEKQTLSITSSKFFGIWQTYKKFF